MQRHSAVIAPTDRVQTYQGDLAPCKSRKDLANWTWVRSGNPRAKINNIDIAEKRHWQRHNDNNEYRTLDGTGDNAGS